MITPIVGMMAVATAITLSIPAAQSSPLVDALRVQTIGLHTQSWHDQERPDDLVYQRATPGLYVVTAGGLTVGHYRNSLGDPSTYIGETLTARPLPGVQVGLTLGVITGYDVISPLLPMAIPSVAISAGHAAARFIVMPKISDSQASTAVNLALEWRL